MTHVREFEWFETKRRRNVDGSVSVVRGKCPVLLSDFKSACVEYSPAMTVERHEYFGQHLVWVIEGGGGLATVGAQSAHTSMPLGAEFGPIVAGEEGALFLELTDGDVRSWVDEPASP
jgi:hypothetical protein